MTGVKWPGGARCAVMLTFDFDAETNWLARSPANLRRPGTLSQGTYGAKVGVPRILDLLREQALKATFFVPGWVAEHRRGRVEMILGDGHEVGHHGYLHKWVDPQDPQGELAEFTGGMEALATLGVRPVGYRSPAGETSSNLIRLLAEHDFTYDSSLMDDVFPYRHALADGDPGPVELPWHWSLDDVPYVSHSMQVMRPMFTNDHILNIWQAEFRQIHEWGGLFDLVMHPQAIGRPSRLVMLAQMIAYMRDFPGVWFATGAEVAEAWLEQSDGTLSTEITPFIEELVDEERLSR
ncbi:MAG: polysaccharide deacetylase [Chromatiales bacterium]|jgi:peptidoglycan-N-acetylglucosamine deacetylase|nr:polysaccharide deacetylase [Chromatiales bacterium]